MRVEIHNLLFALSRALDYVESELLGVATNHSKRVALLSVLLAKHMGLTDVAVFDMASCAVLHDNGLTEYTLRQGLGGAQRQEKLEIHCSSGEANARLFPFQGDTRNIVLHHHENWDGSGIFGCKAEAIRPRAAILRLADNMDLRLRLNDGNVDELLEAAREHTRKRRGTIYSPDVADAFLELCDEYLFCEMRDDTVDEALTRHIPALDARISSEELLCVCEIFSGIIDDKSPLTCTHSRGVAAKTARLTQYLNLEREHAQRLQAAAHLHDLGKLTTPAAILEKPGTLTPEEYAVMREHVLGTRILLEPIRGLEDIALWASTHHEKCNGQGYPLGLDAEALPFESRLLACVDIYQALTEDRPYRSRIPHSQAVEILRMMAGKGELDPETVEHIHKAFASGGLH